MDDAERAHAVVAAIDAAAHVLRKLYFYVDTDSPRWADRAEELLPLRLEDVVISVGEPGPGALRDDIARIRELLRSRDRTDVHAELRAVDEALDVFFAFKERAIKALPIRPLLTTEDPSPEVIATVQGVSDELIKHIQRRPSMLYDIGPRQFEELVAHILEGYGWEVKLTPPTRDGGYDIFAISRDRSGERSSWIIECKRHARDRKVGIEIARSLYCVKGELGVGMAMLATTSHFTRGVRDFKMSRWDFQLRDFEGILEWINEYRPNPMGRLYVKDGQLIVPEAATSPARRP